ncbi:phosphate ABC transporter substrate-binding protein [Burkholderia stabilis]|uniref:Phosphate ABC transporter substrate-binding protein n=1 Tax=Burkholderia stabilis TaxID=95485 RepID=A0A4Q2AD41_9BURK|nr:substrate-binding domain-containing protein [Burkholderia stabilis]RXV67606.1 phosphate ABC transporter substrate-binding protein [Burkholderia stabilis]
MNSFKRKICQALTLVVSGMNAEHVFAAGPIIQGGGSSLVAPLLGSTANPATEIGLFGTSEGTFTYYSVGSGAGQYAFLNNQPTFFGAGVTGAVHFANSDAALTTAQVTAYNNTGRGTTDGPLIQIPFIVTAITVPIVNGPAVTSSTTPQTTPGQAHSIALNDDDLCGIFSGKITNWNQVVNPESGSIYPLNKPIVVVYRTDASGTTELLTRHLAAVCTSANTASGVTFRDSMTFADTHVFPWGAPSNFIGVSASWQVRGSLASLSSNGTAALAYLSPAYTNTFLAPMSIRVTSTGALQLPVASLLNTKDRAYYAPTYVNATKALGRLFPPSIANNAADPTQWAFVSGTNYINLANPASGYPVSGTSQIIVSQCYSDPAVATAIHDMLTLHYTNSAFTSIVRGNGFDMVPPYFQTAIVADFLSNASGFSLDIGNTSVCNPTWYTGR